MMGVSLFPSRGCVKPRGDFFAVPSTYQTIDVKVKQGVLSKDMEGNRGFETTTFAFENSTKTARKIIFFLAGSQISRRLRWWGLARGPGLLYVVD